MHHDELRQPLRKRGTAERLWARRPGALSVAYGASLSAFAALAWWAVQQPAPFAGEPIVTVGVPPAQVITTASTEPPAEPVPPAEEGSIADAVVDGPETVTDDNPAAQDVADPPEIREERVAIVSGRRSLAVAPVDSVSENTAAWGLLPKISPTGERPSKVYARPVSLDLIHSDQPKIAIVLGGMGLNQRQSARAAKELPGEVTLAFAPYGLDLQQQVNEARKSGHEVFLQVPLEPLGFPANNPGPRTLLGEGTDAENIDSLRWHLGRFAGYSGVMNYMGGRFLSMPKSLKPMFQELKSRGLLFVEDGSLALSSTEVAAKSANLQARRAKMVIDLEPSPQAIAAALGLLEQEAKQNGFAIGTGSGLEVTIDVLRDWAAGAEERGITLVPLTAAFKGRTG